MSLVTSPADTGTPIALDGARALRGNLTRARIRWVIALLLVVFAIVAGRLVQLASVSVNSTIEGQTRDAITATRPPILDRNGLEMAVDVRVPSLFAEPRRIVDVGEAVDALLTVLPELDRDWLTNRLTGTKGFVWVKRELTPALQDKILQLGIPGLDFVTESRRFYPGGSEAAHILGAVNIDNQGIAGIERHMDGEDVALLQQLGLARDQALTPVSLSVDLRVQHVMHEQLVDALSRYRAVAAAGVMVDVRTGEILALSSLPDFDPNDPKTALVQDRFNRITAGVYEVGSTMKTVTIAGALDSGKARITDQFDARFGIRFGRHTIDDFHGKHRILSMSEVYKYSSNIGTIKIMQAMGKDEFRAFLSKLGFDKPLRLELPEGRAPVVPERFSEVVAATASFGHGMSITPLHLVAAMAGFVNDGKMIPPTLYRRTEAEAEALATPIVSAQTSKQVRYLMRLNALEGSGTRMNKAAAGYRAGGKTGTAQKVVNGRYSSSLNFNVFASAFPLENPRYAMVILVDEPKAEAGLLASQDTAGYNAGEVTGRIVKQVAPLLGVAPDFSDITETAMVPAQLRR